MAKHVKVRSTTATTHTNGAVVTPRSYFREDPLVMQLLRGTCFGIVIIDFDMRILWVNPFFKIMLGDIPQGYENRNFTEFLPETDSANFMEMTQQIQSGVFPFGWIEIRMRSRYGGTLWMGLNISYPGGIKSGELLLVMFDITARKTDEQQIRSLRETLSEIRRTALIGQALYDPETDNISLSSDWLPSLFPSPLPDRVSLETFLGIVHDKDRNPLREFIHRLPLNESIDFHIRLINGKMHFLRSVAQRRIVQERKPVLMIIAQDITAWWESEQRFQRIFHDNRLPLLLVEAITWRITAINSAAEMYYGLSENDLLRTSLQDLEISPENSQLKDLIAENILQTRHRLASGEVREVLLHPSRLLDSEGDTLFIIVLDITDRIRTEQQLSDVNRNLEQRVETEIAKVREQEEKISHQSRLAALGEMAAGMAHEINQPLNTISMTLDNLLSEIAEELPTDFVKEKTAKIFQNIQRLRTFIDHIRTLSRAQDEVINDAFAISDCIRSALTLTGGPLRREGIEIVQKLESVPLIFGNAYKLEQVILNLLANSRDAIEEKALTDKFDKRIEIRLSAEDKTLLLEVEDNGIGIESRLLSRVMEPFYTTKSPNRGTGIGLSIAYSTIREMGGTIEIYSRQRQWTLVRIEFPLPREDE